MHTTMPKVESDNKPEVELFICSWYKPLGQCLSDCNYEDNPFADKVSMAITELMYVPTFSSDEHDAHTQVADLLHDVVNYSCIEYAHVLLEQSIICSHFDGVVLCATCKDVKDCNFWLLDSGASNHFTFCLEDFIDYNQWSTPGVLGTATSSAKILGSSTVMIKVPGNEQVLRIENVHYVPKLVHCLLLQGQFLWDGCTITRDEHSVQFLQNHTEYLTAYPQRPSNTLYGVHTEVLTQEFAGTLSTIKFVNYETMHRHMGHPSKEVLKHLWKHAVGFPKSIEIPKEQELCHACQLGKMHQRTFKESDKHVSHPFEVIHSDLKMYPVNSYHKNQYVMVFFDNHTSYAWETFLKKKSEAFAACQHFLAMVQNQYKTSVEVWCCNQGGEYVGQAFKDLLKDHSIKACWSPPHTLQINRCAEHFMCTFSDKADAMCIQACFPDSWWEFAVAHTFYMYNCTPLERLKWKTPFEAVEYRKPDVLHLCVLRCGAYMFVLVDNQRNKLAPCAEFMTYIGQGESGWKFMNSNRRIQQSTTITWDEDLFPWCKTQAPLHQTAHVDKVLDQEGSNTTKLDEKFEFKDLDIPTPAPPLSSSPEQPGTPTGNMPEQQRAAHTMQWQTYSKLQHSNSDSEGADPQSPTPQWTVPAKHISLPLPALRKSSRVPTQTVHLQNAEKTGSPPEADDQFRCQVEGLPPCKACAPCVHFPSEVPSPSSAQSETESMLTKPSMPPKSLTGTGGFFSLYHYHVQAKGWSNSTQLS
jgi:hypothetical protein